jgi:hypothetical protein
MALTMIFVLTELIVSIVLLINIGVGFSYLKTSYPECLLSERNWIGSLVLTGFLLILNMIVTIMKCRKTCKTKDSGFV